MNRKCLLYQKIVDYDCTLQGYSCGPNMTFRTIAKEEFRDAEITGVSCTVICDCANEFYEKNGECIAKERIPLQSNPVGNKIFSKDFI